MRKLLRAKLLLRRPTPEEIVLIENQEGVGKTFMETFCMLIITQSNVLMALLVNTDIDK